jgi:ankyrin repeat protein
MMPTFHSAKIRLNRSLLAACTRGDTRQAASLLSAGGTPHNCVAATILGGHRACFTMLVKRGVPIDPGPMGPIGLAVSPIYAAIQQSGDSWFFHALIELGVETNRPDRLGRTPLIYAIEQGCRHAVPSLAERDHASLAAAMSRQYRDAWAAGGSQLPAPTQMLAALLDAGVNPNFQPRATEANDQSPPLHAAVCADDINAVCLLAKAGVDPFLLDGRGMSANDMLHIDQLRMRRVIEAVEAAHRSGKPFDASTFEVPALDLAAADLFAPDDVPQPPAEAPANVKVDTGSMPPMISFH